MRNGLLIKYLIWINFVPQKKLIFWILTFISCIRIMAGGFHFPAFDAKTIECIVVCWAFAILSKQSQLKPPSNKLAA